MSKTIEVFADITCPFTHVGLARVTEQLASAGSEMVIRVRAWPLEWVNGSPLDVDAVAAKAAVLRDELGVDLFSGINRARWPSTTVPALNLAASAYSVSPELGLGVSLELRSALFERGLDIADPAVLASMAAAHGLDRPDLEPSRSVLADYSDGLARGVKGSPDFFIADTEYFCPALDLGHDEAGALTARFDAAGLEAFMSAALGGRATNES